MRPAAAGIASLEGVKYRRLILARQWKLQGAHKMPNGHEPLLHLKWDEMMLKQNQEWAGRAGARPFWQVRQWPVVLKQRQVWPRTQQVLVQRRWRKHFAFAHGKLQAGL